MPLFALQAGPRLARLLLVQSAILVAVGAQPASAQEQPAATPPAASAPDAIQPAAPATAAAPSWRVVCGGDGQAPAEGAEATAPAAPAAQGCALVQRLAASPEGPRVLQVTLRPFRPSDPPAAEEGETAQTPAADGVARMRLDLPLGLNLPAGVGLLIDGEAWARLPVRTCVAAGCFAGAILKEEDVARLKRGTRMGVAVQALNGRTVAWPVTLAGFTAGYDQMIAGDAVSAEETAAAEAKAEPVEVAAEPNKTAAAQPGKAKGTKITCSRGFSAWMRANNLSIGFTSYQSGRLYLVGRNGKGGVSFHERYFQRSMGLWGSPQRLLLSTMYQIWRFENVLGKGEVYRVQENGKPADYDRHYVPRFATTTGDIDVHEIGVMADGRIVFVNTAYSCLATLSQVHSFKPYWKPPFISKLAAEDRCHLNGMAMRDGAPAFVTAVSRSDVVNGWRERRDQGGTIIDIASNEVVTDKLSMPHSPRWHDGSLWVLNSGTGYLGRIDAGSGAFQPLVFCPGFLRGLQFHAGHAIVGLSLPRNGSFSGLQLDEELKKRDAEPWCGVQIINLKTGDIVQWVRMEGEVTELFDVCVLPGVSRPMSTGIMNDDIHRMVTIEPGEQKPAIERS